VWTANHVVADDAVVKVVSVIRHNYHRVGETTFSGTVIARSEKLDVALLHVDCPPEYFLSAEFDSVIPPSVGSAVYHAGNFFGADFDNSVSTGVISQHGAAPKEGWRWLVVDQTTSAFVPGSSGGPVFNARNDKVIGIVVAIIPGTSMNFYVPVRALEVWADSAGLTWAVRGDKSPLVLPSVAPPSPKVLILFGPPAPEQNKKKK
jgi:S1-C subfamily serine protease